MRSGPGFRNVERQSIHTLDISVGLSDSHIYCKIVATLPIEKIFRAFAVFGGK